MKHLLLATTAIVFALCACSLFQPGGPKQAAVAACAVVDAAKQACAFITYLAPDGTLVTVKVDEADLREFGAAMQAKQAAKAKAAASGSASAKP